MKVRRVDGKTVMREEAGSIVADADEGSIPPNPRLPINANSPPMSRINVMIRP